MSVSDIVSLAQEVIKLISQKRGGRHGTLSFEGDSEIFLQVEAGCGDDKSVFRLYEQTNLSDALAIIDDFQRFITGEWDFMTFDMGVNEFNAQQVAMSNQ